MIRRTYFAIVILILVFHIYVDTACADELRPAMIVTNPSGGEVWASGSTHEIKWQSYGITGNVEILLSKDGGNSWEVIRTGLGNTGSYQWHVPGWLNSTQCIIIVQSDDPEGEYTGSGSFTVQRYRPVRRRGFFSIWPTQGHDFRRSGLSKYTGPKEDGVVKWQFETEGSVTSGVAVSGQRHLIRWWRGYRRYVHRGPLIGKRMRGIKKDSCKVHIASQDGNLYTVDSEGELIWEYDANSPLLSSPTVSPRGVLYVGSEDGKLHAVSIDGKLQWTYSTDGFITSSVAAGNNGRVFFGSEDGNVYAIDRRGSKLWQFETSGYGLTNGAVLASPAIGIDESVYVGGVYDANLYALDPNNGSVKWQHNFAKTYLTSDGEYTVKSRLIAAPAVGSDGTIYVTLIGDPNLYAIEPNEGNVLWTAELIDAYLPAVLDRFTTYTLENYLPPFGWSSPAIGPDGTIYVSTDKVDIKLTITRWWPRGEQIVEMVGGQIMAVDPNGSVKWVEQFGDIGGFTLAVGSDGLIYAAGDDGLLRVIDSDGEQLAEFEIGSGALSYPVIGNDGTLYISGMDNLISAISSDSYCDNMVKVRRVVKTWLNKR